MSAVVSNVVSTAVSDQQSLEHRAAIFAALGDPVRLRIADDLVLSDRSPTELSQRHGLNSNLLAHHLGVLVDAGIITRVTSAGDARRRYVCLNRTHRDVLTLLLATPTAPVSRFVFLCTHNSARSQLAAALWTARSGHVAHSAGTHPAPGVHQMAIEAATRHNLDLSEAVPRLIDTELLDAADLQVVTVCDRVHEDVDPAEGWWHWSIPDPVEADTADAFDDVLAELDLRISVFFPSGTSKEAA
jgi:ArsR family transcriptional regulator, arsenate/arsenite/antimonite-responsive transcriptional repressor / arsenate reductase (thioredoxin)